MKWRAVVWCLLLFGMGLSSSRVAQAETATGFIPPGGMVELSSDSPQKITLAFLDFISPRRDRAELDGWVYLFAHDLQYRGLGRGSHKLHALDFDEMRGLFRKELGVSTVTPAQMMALADLLSTDYAVYIDERLTLDGWVWCVRVYNGRSGAYLARTDIPVIEEHWRWMADHVLHAIGSVLLPMGEALPESGEAPAEALLLDSVKRFGRIVPACQKGQCLTVLDDLEWIGLNNREFSDSLQRDPVYLNMLMREADDPVSLARIGLWAGNAFDVLLRIENLLKNTKDRKMRVRLLELAIEAAVALGQGEKAEKLGLDLKAIDVANPLVNAALGVGLQMRERCREAMPYLMRASGKTRLYPQVLDAQMVCCRDQEQPEQLWKSKERLADYSFALENFPVTAPRYLELLDHDFQTKFLNRIPTRILSRYDRRNLSTLLNQKGAVHVKNDAEVFRRLAELMLLEKRYDEADRILRGALQVYPQNSALVLLAVREAIKTKEGVVRAQRLMEGLKEHDREPLLQLRLMKETGQNKAALDLIDQTDWPAGWADELVIIRAGFLMRAEKYSQAAERLERLKQAQPEREDVAWMLADAYEQLGRDKDETAVRALAWLLGGKPLPEVGEERFANLDYAGLILPHPLVRSRGAGKLEAIGSVILLDGSGNVCLENDCKLKQLLRMYVPQEEGRTLHDVLELLKTRYTVVESEIAQTSFKERVFDESTQPFKRWSNQDLVEFASTLNVEGLFILKTEDSLDLETETLEKRTQLFFFDATMNRGYATGNRHEIELFSVYRFNSLYMIVPLLVILIMLYLMWEFRRIMQHWGSPVLKAQYLIAHKNFRKAADVMERFGYTDDAANLRAHAQMNQGHSDEALELFMQSRDYENALVVLKYCSDSPAVQATAAELYFIRKDYERAEAYYRKTRNLIGIAKVNEALGRKEMAARVLGQYYFESANPMAAIEEYRKIEDYDSIGMVYFYYHKFKHAAVMFQQSGNDEMAKKCLLRQGVKAKNGGFDRTPEGSNLT